MAKRGEPLEDVFDNFERFRWLLLDSEWSEMKKVEDERVNEIRKNNPDLLKELDLNAHGQIAKAAEVQKLLDLAPQKGVASSSAVGGPATIVQIVVADPVTPQKPKPQEQDDLDDIPGMHEADTLGVDGLLTGGDEQNSGDEPAELDTPEKITEPAKKKLKRVNSKASEP